MLCCKVLVTARKVVREGNVSSCVCLFTKEGVVSMLPLPVMLLVIHSSHGDPSTEMFPLTGSGPSQHPGRLFTGDSLGPGHGTPGQAVDLPRPVKICSSIAKRKVGLRLKGLLVISIFYTFTDVESFKLIKKTRQILY